jgi:cytochrome c oxidase subunit III
MLGTPYISPTEALERRMRYHPVRVFTYLIILGISSAFLTLISSYLVTLIDNHVHGLSMPSVFHANTIIILASSYSVYQMRQAYRRDDQATYRQALWMTTGLGLAFCAFQVYGWQLMLAAGLRYQHDVSAAYLYLISGLHLLHLLVGIGALGWLVYLAYRQDALSELLFTTDPASGLRVDMLALYWHFVDLLWLLLYLCFLGAERLIG